MKFYFVKDISLKVVCTASCQQWRIQDFEKGKGVIISQRQTPGFWGGGDNMRHTFMIAYFSYYNICMFTSEYFSTIQFVSQN